MTHIAVINEVLDKQRKEEEQAEPAGQNLLLEMENELFAMAPEEASRLREQMTDPMKKRLLEIARVEVDLNNALRGLYGRKQDMVNRLARERGIAAEATFQRLDRLEKDIGRTERALEKNRDFRKELMDWLMSPAAGRA